MVFERGVKRLKELKEKLDKIKGYEERKKEIEKKMKVVGKIPEIRKVKPETDLHSPPYHSDISDKDDLKSTVARLREKTNGKPIFIKLAAGHIEEDITLALYAEPDAVVIDGYAGGTGAAPLVMLDHFGVLTISAVVRARKVLDELDSDVDLIVSGGLNSGADMAKALALGADAVYIGFAALGAMGCIGCYLCNTGKCPKGVTTHDPEYANKFDPDAAQKLANFINACTARTFIRFMN